MKQPIQELAFIFKKQQSFTFEKLAIEAFKYFRKMANEQVIDVDVLDAILHDAGVNNANH